MFRIAIKCLGLLLVMAGCVPTYCNYSIEGADEFVCDSYCIRDGKLSILEMQGYEVYELPDNAMEEYVDFRNSGYTIPIFRQKPCSMVLIRGFFFIR